ncbi:MAG: hypothetical protein IPG79_07255 [Saprospiraceae bacterium]|nr:hypothetical protein [Saprospiraceae bacterium]
MFLSVSLSYEDIFILGEKYAELLPGIVKFPFKENPGKFGMAIQEENTKRLNTTLEKVVKKYGIEIEKNNENYEKNGLYIFSFSKKMKEEEQVALLERLKKETKALTVGPVVQQSEKMLLF